MNKKHVWMPVLLLAGMLVALAGCSPTSITINEGDQTLTMGATTNLTTTLVPSLTADIITWSSSNQSVAYVLAGYVVAIMPGTATLTATTSNGLTDEITVNVTLPNAQEILDKLADEASTITAFVNAIGTGLATTDSTQPVYHVGDISLSNITTAFDFSLCFNLFTSDNVTLDGDLSVTDCKFLLDGNERLAGDLDVTGTGTKVRKVRFSGVDLKLAQGIIYFAVEETVASVTTTINVQYDCATKVVTEGVAVTW